MLLKLTEKVRLLSKKAAIKNIIQVCPRKNIIFIIKPVNFCQFLIPSEGLDLTNLLILEQPAKKRFDRVEEEIFERVACIWIQSGL